MTGNLLPGLTTVKDEKDDDDDSSDDDDDDKGNAGTIEANLLGVFGPSPNNKATESKKSSTPTMTSTATGAPGTDVAAMCRDVSLLLNFTLKPSPMKPAGSKAQRKKQQSPPAAVEGTDLLSAPIDLSIFDSLIQQDLTQRGSNKLSMEAVSFTQQKPLRVIEHSAIDAVSSGVDFSNMAGGPSPLSAALGMGGGGGGFSDGGIGGNIGELGGSAAASFQRTSTQDSADRNAGTPSTRPQTVNDPFYLNSGPASLMETEMTGVGGAGVAGPAKSGFGMIELGDAEESDDEDVKKSKKKKKHKKKSKGSTSTGNAASSHDNLGMLTPALGAVTLYDSDDEDDDDEPRRLRGPNRKAKPGKEFSGLAAVDLTQPLREDEVMPERKHRVVPDRSFEDAPASATMTPPASAASSKKDKKKKKKRESKRNKHAASAPADSGGVGDLLDLGGFASAPQTSTMTSAAPAPAGPTTPGIMTNQANPINNAFDDLLGLSMASAPAPTLPSGSSGSGLLSSMATVGEVMKSPPEKQGGKRPWMRATIKASHASGSPMVDWSKVSLLFRVYRSNNAASVVIRVDNHMEMSALSDLKLQLKGYGGGDIVIGRVGPGCSSAESAKVGPFTFTQPDASLDMKGTLVTADCSVSVKLSLPASMQLTPVEGLALEDVARQLSSSEWSSNSAKLESRTGLTTTPDKVKELLCSFLRAAEVEPGSSGPANGTFAAQSAQGSQVRVLVKVKTDTVKVDVKCTNPQLGKALVSDLKRLVL